MPEAEANRLVVGVPDLALHVHLGIPLHESPDQSLHPWIFSDQRYVLPDQQTVGVLRADVDRLTARPVANLGVVRLAAVASDNRLISEDELLVHSQIRSGQEEPLALADVGGVLTAAEVQRFTSLNGECRRFVENGIALNRIPMSSLCPYRPDLLR